MIHVLLSQHKSNNWVKSNTISFRGWFYEHDSLCTTVDMTWANGCHGRQLVDMLRAWNGNYAIIIQNNVTTQIAVDRICSYPLYYAKQGKDFYISDSIVLLRDTLHIVNIDTNAKNEFLGAGFVFRGKTLFAGINQLLAGQYLEVSNETGEYKTFDYFLHLHSNQFTCDAAQMCELLDRVVVNSVKRMIDSIDGRQIVLFLSGGYDSKLIAATLKRLKYDNVLCVSLGPMSTKDVSIGKKIAESIGYPWMRIDVSKKMWRRYRREGLLEQRVNCSCANSNLAYVQGMTLYELQKDGKLPDNCVAVTGNSGDAIEGADVTHMFSREKTCGANDVVNAIRNRHLVLSGYKYSMNPGLYSDIYPYLVQACGDREKYTDVEAEEIYEFFNWRERQAKYVVSDVRNYDDYLGIDWRLPLWDNEFVDFWLRVPYELRYDRKLYFQYVKADTLPSANDITLMRKAIDWAKNNVKLIAKLLYPIKNLSDYLFSPDYYFASYGIADFPEFLKAWRITKGYRGAPHTVLLYYTWDQCYRKYEEDR